MYDGDIYAAVNFELPQREIVQSENCCSQMFSNIFWESGEIFYLFHVVFWASTGKKLQVKTWKISRDPERV